MAQHLHKLPAFRHPVSKSRALIAPIHGTRNGYQTLLFLFCQRTAYHYREFPSKQDAERWLHECGYKPVAGGVPAQTPGPRVMYDVFNQRGAVVCHQQATSEKQAVKFAQMYGFLGARTAKPHA